MKILFMPTMRYDLQGDHCRFSVEDVKGQSDSYVWHGYGKAHPVEKELKWFEWIAYLNRFRPYHLELSGGEPLAYPGIADLLSHIPSNSGWAITSNTLLDVTNIPRERCYSWTATWHPETPLKEFERNIKFLKREQMPVSVSVRVPTKNQKPNMKMAWDFRRKGYRVNLLCEEKKKLKKLKKLEAEGFNIVEDQETCEKGFDCFAGGSYICAMPDGRVYRCYSDAMRDDPMGHIGKVKLLEKSQDCWKDCTACNFEHQFRGTRLNSKPKGEKKNGHKKIITV